MYAIVLGLVLVLLVIAWSVVRHYSDPSTSHPLSTFATTLALLCSLMCVLLIPLDVFVASGAGRSLQDAAASGNTAAVMLSAAAAPIIESLDGLIIKAAYYILFCAIAALAFVVLPFTYFFVEDAEDDDLMGSGKDGCFDRATSSLRNTLIFVIVLALLLVAALFYKPVTSTLHSDKSKDVHHWVDTLMSEWGAGALERGLTLAIGCMTVIGLLNLCYYTAYGLAALPLALMRSRPALEDQQLTAEYDAFARQQKITLLEEKLSDSTTSQKMRAKLSEELDRLRQQDRASGRRLEKLELQSADWAAAVWRWLYPVRATVGAALLCVAAGVAVTLALSVTDMWLHSPCGVRCGFLMDRPTWYNPADRLLVWVSRFFPLDFVVFGVFALYLLVCTLYGVVVLGVRIAGFQVFQVKPRRTWPQALLLLCAIVMFALLAIMVEAVAIAPQYATFGRQTYTPEPTAVSASAGTSAAAASTEQVPCVLSQTSKTMSPLSVSGRASDAIFSAQCVQTRLSRFLARLTTAYPIFSLIFYCAHWLFIVIVVGTALFKCVRRGSPGAGGGAFGSTGAGAGAGSDLESDDEEAGAYRPAATRGGAERRSLLK